MKFLDWELLGWGRGQVRDWVLPVSSVPDTVEADFASRREVCGYEKNLLESRQCREIWVFCSYGPGQSQCWRPLWGATLPPSPEGSILFTDSRE